MQCNPQKCDEEAKVSCLEGQLQSKHEVFAALHKENIEFEHIIEDYRMKISERYNVKAKVEETYTLPSIK